jgi:3-dehydroquinate synthase class II
VPRTLSGEYLEAVRDVGSEGLLFASGDDHARGVRFAARAIMVDKRGTLRRGGRTLGSFLPVTDAASQARAAQMPGIVVAQAPDWKAIPLEDLIAARRGRPGALYASTRSPEEALAFAHVLQGIVLAPARPNDIRAADRLLRLADLAPLANRPRGAAPP